jgi:NDP-sugar pyrophosphorylase family protein
MRPFTDTIPKPLLPVFGRPFLEYQIELLQTNGITGFLLLVSYLGHLIEEHFGSTYRGAQIHYSHESSPLGTGGALKNAAALLDDDFLVLNGDTLLDIDYRAFAAAFRASGVEAMVAAYRNTAANVPSNLAIDENGLVLEYQKQRPAGEYVDAGVLALRKSALSLVPEDRKCSLEEETFPKLIQRGQLLGWATDQPFYDMGTPAGMQMLEAHISAAKRVR